MKKKPKEKPVIPRTTDQMSSGASALLEGLRSGGKPRDPSHPVSQMLAEVSSRRDAINYQPRPPGTPTREAIENRRRKAQEDVLSQMTTETPTQTTDKQPPVENTISTDSMITQPTQVGHFNTQEFACKGTGKVKVSPDLVNRLNQLRDYLGVPIHVTSGYRSPEHNRTIQGAAPNSRHLSGEAADIFAEGISTQQLGEAAKKFFGDGGIGIYSGHVHVDIGPQRRW